ncbi:alkane hydroxylase MAH1-like [Diospyros lotus]|uniref:alkane hydroxylase MAH1-like n=1 Tax=Diospyros lotus TaxID=55363 RepID=UPI0022528435|nr:alkane hydroxylase MAH1-like [Diospyros lotus]
MALLHYYEILLAFMSFLLIFLLANQDGIPVNWPILGMLPGLLIRIHRIHSWIAEILPKVGGTFLLKGPWFTSMEVLCTVLPADVHYIMSSNFSNFPKGPQFKEMFDILGDGIFNSDGDVWQDHRKVGQLFVSHLKFHRFSGKTSRDKVKKGLVPVLDHASDLGLVVDLQDVFQRLTFDTTCMLVTGYDPGCLSPELPRVPFADAMDDAERVILLRHVVPESIWKLQRWLGIGSEKRLKDAWVTLDHVILKYIAKKREELSKGIKSQEDQEEGVDLLTSYLTTKDETIMGSFKCDDKFLRDTTLSFFIAGRDTISSALTWFIYLVSTHCSVEAKIIDELKSVVPEKEPNKWRLFTLEEVNKLVYLHSAICEALRLYPPVPFQHKAPLRPDTLPSGHSVHPKTKILFSLYAMGRMKFIWGEDCSEFKPERWISEQGTIKHEPSYKFLSFNAGPRTCIGKELAFNQIKVVAAAIIYNYRIRVAEGHPVTPNVSIILYMKHGFRVKITKRWLGVDSS